MTQPTPASGRPDGAALRAARVARVQSIRQRVIAGALALFVATWILITLILVTGHDPALAKSAAAKAATAQTTTGSTATTSDSGSAGSTGTSSTGSTSTTASSSGTTSAVTTSQS